MAGGSALAQFGDYASVTCEVFDSSVSGKVDFLWVVDNSGSMETSQTAVGAVGTVFGDKLANAGLDWRVAGVTTDGKTRAFTNDINSMKRWFTKNDALWFDSDGSGNERTFSPVMSYVASLLPRSATPVDTGFARRGGGASSRSPTPTITPPPPPCSSSTFSATS
ncbi:MAG: hypothetical protein IPJ65_38930 [Archangiaceae bacterium]|nr:hypothetical protein [Archangiaceae bacterium]